jgi:hypothetical protein
MNFMVNDMFIKIEKGIMNEYRDGEDKESMIKEINNEVSYGVDVLLGEMILKSVEKTFSMIVIP